MTLYARSDVTSVCVPAGCGSGHAKPPNTKTWALTCSACEPLLTLDTAMWCADASRIPLTPDEESRLEKAAKEGSAAQVAMVNELGKATVEILQNRTGGTLLQQIAALSDEDKAMLREALGTPATTRKPRTRKAPASDAE